MLINNVDKKPFVEAVNKVIDDFLASASDEQKEFYNLIVETRNKY